MHLHVAHLHGAFHNAARIVVDHLVLGRYRQYVLEVAAIARLGGKQQGDLVYPGFVAGVGAGAVFIHHDEYSGV